MTGREDGRCNLATVALQACTTNRDGADAEGEDVGERRDGDGDAGVLHRLADPLGERDLLGGLVAAREEVVPALHYDEHVVDADA